MEAQPPAADATDDRIAVYPTGSNNAKDLAHFGIDNLPADAVVKIEIPGYPELVLTRTPYGFGLYGGSTKAFKPF